MPEGTLKQFFINIFEQASERLFIAGALRSGDRHINGCLCKGAGNYWSWSSQLTNAEVFFIAFVETRYYTVNEVVSLQYQSSRNQRFWQIRNVFISYIFLFGLLQNFFFFFLLACGDERKLKFVLTLWCSEAVRASLAINLCKSSIKWSLEQESKSGEDNLRVGKNPQRFALCLSHSPWGHSPLTHTCTYARKLPSPPPPPPS